MSTLQKGPNGSNPPRLIHMAACFNEGPVISTLSQSASEQYQFFLIPTSVYVVGGVVKGSQPTGVTGQAVFKLGIAKGDASFGTYTVSGGAALASRLTVLGPITMSDQGSLYSLPVIATIQSGATATTSLSLYVMLEYTHFGNLNLYNGGDVAS